MNQSATWKNIRPGGRKRTSVNLYRATPSRISEIYFLIRAVPLGVGGLPVKQVAIATRGYGCLEPARPATLRDVFTLVTPIPPRSKVVSPIYLARDALSLSLSEGPGGLGEWRARESGINDRADYFKARSRRLDKSRLC